MAIRILVVDDATFIRDTVKRHLREKLPGAEVYDVASGSRAVALLNTQAVDLVLSDWEMPGMSGEELLRWVRSDDKYRDLPFIMVTSRGDRDHVVKAVDAGVSDYISKPFTPDELIKKVCKQLQKIGKAPALNPSGSGGATQGIAFASVQVLTGGRPPLKTSSSSTSRPDANGKAAGRSSSPQQAANPAKVTPSKRGSSGLEPPKTKAIARLRFAKESCDCVVRDITLQSMSGLIQRRHPLPALFDQVVVDIEIDSGKIARINGYIHAIEAGENRLDAQFVKMVVRFVDQDPQKFEVLSRYIDRL